MADLRDLTVLVVGGVFLCLLKGVCPAPGVCEVLSRGSQVRGRVGSSNRGGLTGQHFRISMCGAGGSRTGRGTVTRRPRWCPGGWDGPSEVFSVGQAWDQALDIPSGMWVAQHGGDSPELVPFRDEPRSS